MKGQGYVTISADGVPIHYDVQGDGAIALVFVHGWCCNRHYWDRQVGHFASQHTVVSLDLAGHGASGRDRTQWTVPTFGQDVVAVVEQLGLEQVGLVGHSLGGPVIVEAARRLRASVIGLVGADTWHNVQQMRTAAQIEKTLAPFRTNFADAARALVRTMFVPTSDATLVEDIVTAMSAAPPGSALSVIEELLRHDRQLQEGLQEVEAPKMTINTRHWIKTNLEGLRRYGIEVALMSGVGHFVMMEDPQTFNHLLHEAVKGFLSARVPQ
jgi:pimeloyl-ACP methyl ester carboxylesterase